MRSYITRLPRAGRSFPMIHPALTEDINSLTSPQVPVKKHSMLFPNVLTTPITANTTPVTIACGCTKEGKGREQAAIP